MADKRISQLIERVDIANDDVLPIVASGATTTNKVTISTIQDWMQDNIDLGVTSVGITLGTTGTNINVTGSPVTSSGNITINIPTASASNRGALSSADWSTFNSKVSSVGLSMPSAFSVANSPITGSGTIAVTGAGTVSQYVRGDGSLADFPQGGGGGGASVSYYLNGSVSQGTIGGIAYLEMNKTPILGAGTDFTIAADGYIASFITDAGDPALLEIPAGNWNFETYFQASSVGGSPSFYVELYKVNSGGTATLIASNSTNPELIAFGTNTTPYFSTLAVPTTVLTITDRLALRYYVTHSGRTITLHTENGNLCQIITTFTTGLTALNGLTAQVQNFATGTSGTDFAISSATNIHTFNLPTASATNRGALSSADWTTFNGKVGGTGASGQVAFWNGTSSQTGDTALTYDSTNKLFSLTRTGGTGPISRLNVTSSSISKFQFTQELSAGVQTEIAFIQNQFGTGLNVNSFNNIFLSAGNTTGFQMFSATRNVLIQNGGTFTDAGFRLDVNGTARVQGQLTTNLTAGSVPFIGASGLLSQDNSTLFWDNTNKRLGIGTNTPDNKISVLSLSGEETIVNIGKSGVLNSGSSKISFGSFNGTQNNSGLISYEVGLGFTRFNFSTNTTSGVNLFNLVNDKVGIGTLAPGGKVEIRTLNNDGLLLVAASVTAAEGPVLGFQTTTGSTSIATAGITIKGLRNNTLIFSNTTSGRVIDIAPTGNLLLNTTTDAGFRLDVNGTARVQGNLNVSTGGITLTGAQTIQTSTGNLTLATAGGNGNILLTPNGTGKVGIGTSTPEGSGLTVASGGILVSLDPGANRKVLELYATSTGAKLSSSFVGAESYGSLELLTSGLARLTIADTGAATFSSSVTGKGFTSVGVSGGYTTGDNPYFSIGGNAADTFGAINSPFGDKMRFNAYHGFQWYTSNNGASGSPVSKMILDSAGNVGIGTASPNTKLQVEDGFISTYHPVNLNSAGYGIQFFTNGGGSKNTIASIDISQVGTARSGDIIFSTSNSGAPIERARVTANGLTFNGDTAAANALDDYEEGTWTPTLPNGGTLTLQNARYVKIGQQVTVSFYVTSVNPTNNTAEFRIGGLPFANAGYSPALFFGGSFGYVGTGFLSNWLPITGAFFTYIYFHDNNGSAASKSNANYVSSIAGGVNGEIILTITYFASS